MTSPNHDEECDCEFCKELRKNNGKLYEHQFNERDMKGYDIFTVRFKKDMSAPTTNFRAPTKRYRK